MYKFKLRFYNKLGDLDHEEFFNTKNAMTKRYREVFVLWSPVNPTAWELKGTDWIRILGY